MGGGIRYDVFDEIPPNFEVENFNILPERNIDSNTEPLEDCPIQLVLTLTLSSLSFIIIIRKLSISFFFLQNKVTYIAKEWFMPFMKIRINVSAKVFLIISKKFQKRLDCTKYKINICAFAMFVEA